VRIECYLMDLSKVFMQLGRLESSVAKIIQYDLSTGCGGSNIVPAVAFRPCNIGDIDRVDLTSLAGSLSWRASDCTSEVEFLRAGALLYLNRLEDFLATQQGMCAGFINGNGVDFQSGPVARGCIVSGAQGRNPRCTNI